MLRNTRKREQADQRSHPCSPSSKIPNCIKGPIKTKERNPSNSIAFSVRNVVFKRKKNHFDDESIVFDEKIWMIHLRGVVRGRRTTGSTRTFYFHENRDGTQFNHFD